MLRTSAGPVEVDASINSHPRRVVRLAALFALAAAGAACGSESDEIDTCADLQGPSAAVASNAVFGAAIHPSFIRVGEAQRRALVMVAPGATVPLLCTGVMIDRFRVLTARHCEFGGSAQVGIESPSGSHVDWLVPSLIISHPTLDLSMLFLPADSLEITADVQPIAPLEAALDDAWLDTVVQLAGVGLTERRELGVLRFAAEPIVALTETMLEVDGAGNSGACMGDSGGPVLARGRDGAPRVIGILSDGARNCLGIDRYVRLDTVAQWLGLGLALGSPLASAIGSEAPDCGDVNEVGLCQAGVAMFCEAGRVETRVCEDACGWDAEASGYRCVAHDEDTCAGVSATGHCRDNMAKRCERGSVQRLSCDACGGRCERDSGSGRVGCANYDSNARP